jgi:hypothetical protein
MASSEMTDIELKRQEVTLELMALLGQQLQLESDAEAKKFDLRDEPRAITLICSEEGRQYQLVLSDEFIRLYPYNLSSDVESALGYLGEYLRSTENGRLLLTGQHAYERWTNDTLPT